MKKNKWIIFLMIIIMSLNITIASANTGKPIEVNAENPERIVDFEIEAPIVPEPTPEPPQEPIPTPEPTPEPVPQPTPEPINTSNNRTERPIIEVQNPIIPLGTVRGYLRTDKGEAIPNARLELHSKPTSTFTNDKGYFVFNNVPIGNHKLYLADENYSNELVLLKSLLVKENNQFRAEFTGEQILNLASNGLLEAAQLEITETDLEKDLEMIVSLKVKGTIIVRYLLNGELLDQEELKDLEMGAHLIQAKDFAEYRIVSEREKEVILTEDTPDRTIIVEFELEPVENVPGKFPIWPFALGGFFIAILAVVLRKHIIIYAIEDANGKETLRRIKKKKIKFKNEAIEVDLTREIIQINNLPIKVVFLKNISRRIGGKEIVFTNKNKVIHTSKAPTQINKEFKITIKNY